MLGILLIDKPIGITSHDVVSRVRRQLQTKRVGHAGTLDPLATGLLVVAVGPATRFLQYLPLEPKEYAGVIQFGVSTNTQDAEGQMTVERPIPADIKAAAEGKLPQFRGLIRQTPPMFSAIKKDGKPLYAMARQGLEIEREARTVHIGTYDLSWLDESRAEFRIVCSGGTYVRTLANDLGEALGCGAHLEALRRTKVGRFNVEDAQQSDRLSAADIISLREALPPMELLTLDESQQGHIRQGRAIPWSGLAANDVYGLLDHFEQVFGVARASSDFLQPEVVIPPEVAYGPV